MRAAIEVIAVTNSYVLIKDECEKRNTMSVTNDAEGVVAYIAGQFDLSKRRLFYIDTEGLTDELLVRDSAFAGFKPGHDGVII